MAKSSDPGLSGLARDARPLTKPEIQTAVPCHWMPRCFMLSLMLALNRALTDWHDNSPFNSPPPLAVTLFHSLISSFVLSSYHLSYSPSLFCHLDSSPSLLAGTLPLSCPRRDSPDGPLAPPPPLICSDPCSSLEKKKYPRPEGPLLATIHALWADAIGPSSGVCSMQHAPDMRPGPLSEFQASVRRFLRTAQRPTVLSLHFLDRWSLWEGAAHAMASLESGTRMLGSCLVAAS